MGNIYMKEDVTQDGKKVKAGNIDMWVDQLELYELIRSLGGKKGIKGLEWNSFETIWLAAYLNYVYQAKECELPEGISDLNLAYPKYTLQGGVHNWCTIIA